MKKLLSLLLIMLLTVGFVGCGGKEQKDGGENQSDAQVVEMPEADLVATAARNLGVPDKEGITYEIGEREYWENADEYYKNIIFYENGKRVASADVNVANGAPLKRMFLYEN